MAATFAPTHDAETDAAFIRMDSETILRADRDVVFDREAVFEYKITREVPGGWLVIQNSGTFTAWADVSGDPDWGHVFNAVMLVGSFATEWAAKFALAPTH